MIKELVPRRALEEFRRDGHQPECSSCDDARNTANLNQENALVLQVAQEELEALRARSG